MTKLGQFDIEVEHGGISLTEHNHDAADDELDDAFFEDLQREILHEFTVRINPRGQLELRPRTGGKWRDAAREIEARVGASAVVQAAAWLKDVVSLATQ